MSLLRFSKNSKYIIDFSAQIIDKFLDDDKLNLWYPVIKNDILDMVIEKIKYCKDDLSKTNYSVKELQECAVGFVSNGAFELLEDHKYRVFGTIDLNGPAKFAISIHKNAIHWLMDRGLVSEEDAEEDFLALQDVIEMCL